MDRLQVVKIGGNLIEDQKVLDSFLKDFAALKEYKILVHGGGKEATALGKKMGISEKIHEGRRITDVSSLELITMVYAGKLNKKFVSLLQAESCDALGICGADGNAYTANKRPVKEIDFGFVGDIYKINTSFFKKLIDQNITLVCCAVSHDGNGQLLNTNADTIAASIASALSLNFEVILTYCFEKKGVLKDIQNENSVIPVINTKKYSELKKTGVIAEGMLPKLYNCFEALENGVKEIRIGGSTIFSNDKLFTKIEK